MFGGYSRRFGLRIKSDWKKDYNWKVYKAEKKLGLLFQWFPTCKSCLAGTVWPYYRWDTAQSLRGCTSSSLQPSLECLYHGPQTWSSGKHRCTLWRPPTRFRQIYFFPSSVVYATADHLTLPSTSKNSTRMRDVEKKTEEKWEEMVLYMPLFFPTRFSATESTLLYCFLAFAEPNLESTTGNLKPPVFVSAMLSYPDRSQEEGIFPAFSLLLVILSCLGTICIPKNIDTSFFAFNF